MDCPKCGRQMNIRIKESLLKGKKVMICMDCGHGEEIEVEPQTQESYGLCPYCRRGELIFDEDWGNYKCSYCGRRHG